MTARVAVRVHPGARRTALLARLPGGEWKVAVTAPPAGGRANAAVVELLSGLLGVRRAQVSLRRGAGARAKVFEVEGVDAAAAEARLAAALEGSDGV
ncbi:MAG TPA: DUF167 domain-containing protein [Candidatus Eisenbacteria bacterium]|nr:DUF167 domain-containing protein [Candidatus Eisenbacteria bacterium]